MADNRRLKLEFCEINPPDSSHLSAVKCAKKAVGDGGQEPINKIQ
jgi:hypothetical protein